LIERAVYNTIKEKVEECRMKKKQKRWDEMEALRLQAEEVKRQHD